MSIGKKIKKYRKEKGLTQIELAKKINKSKSTIQKYEASDTMPPIDVLECIANALDVDLINLISDEDNSIEINFVTDSTHETFSKFYAISRDENFIKNILNKETHELNLFEMCLLQVYNNNKYGIDVNSEIIKLLNSDILQKKFNYSLSDLASSKNNLFYIITNIIDCIENSLIFINDTKTKTNISDKQKNKLD